MTEVQFQLSLALPPADLVQRLRALGIADARPITLHRNRRVMISVDRRGGLRVHSGYAFAPDRVVAALARWATPRVRAFDRRQAARVFLAFPVHQYVTAPEHRHRRPAPRPGDQQRITRLEEAHRALNRRWFGGRLEVIEIRLSAKMRRKLGHYEPAAHGPPNITISRRHLNRDGWDDVLETLLHEMVHQWQDETGLPVNHGPHFRRKACELGIEPRAVRREPASRRPVRLPRSPFE